jgi:hypothetical protein
VGCVRDHHNVIRGQSISSINQETKLSTDEFRPSTRMQPSRPVATYAQISFFTVQDPSRRIIQLIQFFSREIVHED